jgi:hypothetical protein
VVYTKVQLQQGASQVQRQARKVQRQARSVQRQARSVQRQAGTAAAGVSSTAQSAAQGVQQAASGMTAGLRAGTLDVRDWAAPRLENAADYTTSTSAPAVSKVVVKKVAPRVSDALRATAKQVKTNRRRSSIRPALAWAALTATVLAGAGAIGTLLWRKYRSGAADDDSSRLDPVSYPAGDHDAMAPESTPSADGVTPPTPDPAPTAW